MDIKRGKNIEPLSKFGRFIMPESINGKRIRPLSYDHFMKLVSAHSSSQGVRCGYLRNGYGDCKGGQYYLVGKSDKPEAISGFCTNGGICFAEFGGVRRPHKDFVDSEVYQFDGTFLVYHPNAEYSNLVKRDKRARQIFELLEKGFNPRENPEMFSVSGWNLKHHKMSVMKLNPCFSKKDLLEQEVSSSVGLARISEYGTDVEERRFVISYRGIDIPARLIYREGSSPDKRIPEKIVVGTEIPMRFRKNIARQLRADPTGKGYNASVIIEIPRKVRGKSIKRSKEKLPRRLKKRLSKLERVFV